MRLTSHYISAKALLLAGSLSLTGLMLLSTTAQAQQFPSGSIAPVLQPQSIANPIVPDKPSALPTEDTGLKDGKPQEIEAGSAEVTKESFHVNHIEIHGARVLTHQTLADIVNPYLGKDLSSSELTDIVNKINKKYQDSGYLTAIAYIPPQDFEGGTIRIEVLEGSIGKIDVTGNKYLRAKVVSDQIQEKPGDSLNIGNLEKELQRLNRTQPFKMKASLTAGDTTGQTNVTLHVKEQQPFQITPFFDNQGRPYLGTYRWGVEASDRNVSGFGDRFALRWVASAGTESATASYTVPVNKHGTEVSGIFGFSHVNLDQPIPVQPEIIGNAYQYGVVVSQPLSREKTFTTDLGFYSKRVSNFFDGVKTSTDDISSFVWGLNFDKFDRYGRTMLRTQHSLAPEWFGANTHFYKMENYATRLVRINQLPLLNKLNLSDSHLLILRGSMQYTPRALPPIEEYQIGGMYSVRGYSEGLLYGDRGYNLSAEYRYPIPGLRYVSPWLNERIQGAAFMDWARTWIDPKNRNSIAGVTNNNGSLLGAGVGLRVRLTDRFQGYTDLGWGLINRNNVTAPGHGQPTLRVHFGVRSDLFSNDFKERTDKVTPIKTHLVAAKTAALSTPEAKTDVQDFVLGPADDQLKTAPAK